MKEKILTPNHAFDSKEETDGYEKSLPIEIGDNVWRWRSYYYWRS